MNNSILICTTPTGFNLYVNGAHVLESKDNNLKLITPPDKVANSNLSADSIVSYLEVVSKKLLESSEQLATNIIKFDKNVD